MSSEHLVSQNLFEKSVMVRGMRWCQSEFKTVGIGSLTANCLCRSHNSALSTADEEAKRYRDVVRWISSDFGPDDGFSCTKQINGFRFAKWMAKTSCNMLASEKAHVPSALSDYAFADVDNPSVNVYMCIAKSDPVKTNDQHIGIYSLNIEGSPNDILVSFLFRGFPWVIGTIDAEPAVPLLRTQFQLDRIDQKSLLPRPREISIDTTVNGFGPVRKGRVKFSWV